MAFFAAAVLSASVWVHRNALEHRGRREEQAVVERVLRIQPVPKDDVRKLERQNRVQVRGLLRAIRCDDGGGIKQALRDHDRVSDRKTLEWFRQQCTNVNWGADRNVVVDQDVVRQRLERLVEVARRIQKSGLIQPFEDVIFGLLHPRHAARPGDSHPARHSRRP